jgi:hypothetical protein
MGPDVLLTIFTYMPLLAVSGLSDDDDDDDEQAIAVRPRRAIPLRSKTRRSGERSKRAELVELVEACRVMLFLVLVKPGGGFRLSA